MNENAEQTRLMTLSLLVIAAVLGAGALIYTRAVMLPFVLALLISYLVSPLVDWLQDNLKAPRLLAILVAFLVIIALITGLGSLLVVSAQGMAENADLYRDRVLYLAAQTLAILDQYELELGQQQVLDALAQMPILAIVQSTAGGVLSFLTTGLLVIIFSGFLLAGRTATLPPGEVRTGFWAEMELKIRRYIITKFATSAATGLFVGVILSFMGLDLALVFGVLTFLLNFIPSIGSIIATFLPLPLAMLQFDNPLWVLAAFLLPGSVQVLIGNIIEPKVMGDSLDLHPLTVLLSLIFWGLIWGPVGMLLAAPIMAVLKIVMERFETTFWVSELMAGRLMEFETLERTSSNTGSDP